MKTLAKLLLLALVLVVAGSAQSPGPSLMGQWPSTIRSP